MGKGGIDSGVCAKLRRLMGNHPYDPQGTGAEVPEPYLLADAVKELYPALSDDELRRMLLHTFIESDFMEVRSVLSVGGKTSADKVVSALARDIIRAYAAEDEDLTAENQRRKELYESLRWPS